MKDLSLEDIRQERLRQDNTDNTVINTEYGTYYGPVRGSLPAGQGKLVFKSGTVYEGGFYQNRFNGQGKVIFSNGDTLIGDFKDNMGQGILYIDICLAGKHHTQAVIAILLNRLCRSRKIILTGIDIDKRCSELLRSLGLQNYVYYQYVE